MSNPDNRRSDFINANANVSPTIEISLADLVLILWRGKWIIIITTVLSIIAGVIYALLSPELFSTSTCFLAKTASKSTGNLGQLATLAGVSIGSSTNVDPSDYLDKVILDRVFITKLLDRTWYYRGDTLTLDEIFRIKPDTTNPNWEYEFFMCKVEAIRGGNVFSLKKDVKSGLLTLSTMAPDPILAYNLNVFALDYISFYIRNSIKSQAKEKRVFIEERIKESKEALEKAEDSLAKFKGSNLVTNLPQTILKENRLTRQVAMLQEVYIQFEKQYELARIEELDNQALVQVVKGAEIPVLRSEPKRNIIVIVSGMVGIVVGLIITVLICMISPLKMFLKKTIAT